MFLRNVFQAAIVEISLNLGTIVALVDDYVVIVASVTVPVFLVVIN